MGANELTRRKRDLPARALRAKRKKPTCNAAKWPADEDEDDGATLKSLDAIIQAFMHACLCVRTKTAECLTFRRGAHR